MTRPRRHLPGQVAALTRRTHGRCFSLRPDAPMNAIAAYEFARSAERSEVEMYAGVVMSNHVHLVVHDRRARRSDFMRDAMSGISSARNKGLGPGDGLWDRRQYGDTVLLDREALENHILYVLLNPVKAGLVARAKDWPGFKIMPGDWEKTIKVPRPESHYGDDQPETIEFTPRRPPGYDDMTLDEVVAYFEKLLKKGEKKIHREMKAQKRTFLGVAGVLATDPSSSPDTPDRRGEAAPRFAACEPTLLEEAQVREKAFRDAYARARKRWLEGKKRCVFPCGTLWLRRNAPITCREHDPSEAGLVANFQVFEARGAPGRNVA
ncbi:hypothetical protein EA187_18630 [Lujinxingia sediminis]|uniref:Transposase IS200-like domain-containing protein n=1 Tax=Lujinxingia sediminis TaxID=2480984 RepID=A0ABY0CPJ9_9DELT|nr:hypothetical protein [Lujinxingia sediminis]RVU41488.1 hypothetical protein EA187_18630 [Lujinxingia sediminis]